MRYPPPGSANLDGKNGIVQQLNIVASFRDLLSLAAGDSMAENLNGLAADAEGASGASPLRFSAVSMSSASLACVAHSEQVQLQNLTKGNGPNLSQ